MNTVMRLLDLHQDEWAIRKIIWDPTINEGKGDYLDVGAFRPNDYCRKYLED